MTPTDMAEALTAERVMAERVVVKGTVKSFGAETGVGLISPDEGDGDVIVQASNVAEGGLKTLTVGARVEYVVDEGPRGLEAFCVVPLG
jgi:CspA family cold shock protein